MGKLEGAPRRAQRVTAQTESGIRRPAPRLAACLLCDSAFSSAWWRLKSRPHLAHKAIGRSEDEDCKSAKLVLLSFRLNYCRVRLFATPWTAAHQAPLPSTVSQSLLKFMSALVNIFCCHFSFKTWGLPSRSSQTVSCKNNERDSLGSVPEQWHR